MLRRCSTAALIALIVLAIAWELWLAPLRAGGSWLALKAVPLILPLRGVVAGNTYTYRWALMLALAYVAEGCVRAYSESAPASILAFIEIVLASAFFVTAIAYVRAAGNRT